MLATSNESSAMKAFDMLSSVIVDTALATAVSKNIYINHLRGC